jgi:WD40 repeat protein
MEKKLRIFDLSKSLSLNGSAATRNADSSTVMAAEGFEIGANVHKGSIKSIVWTHDPNILVTLADDKMIRWWDLAQGSGTVVQEQSVEGEIGSCEFTNVKPEENDIGGGLPVLTVAVGKTIYFYGGQSARNLLKKVVLPYEVVSVALHPGQRKYVTGGVKDTWARVYEYDSGREIGILTLSPRPSFMLTGSRCAQRSPRTDLEHQLLPRWQVVRNWKRRWNYQVVEELHWTLWLVARGLMQKHLIGVRSFTTCCSISRYRSSLESEIHIKNGGPLQNMTYLNCSEII